MSTSTKAATKKPAATAKAPAKKPAAAKTATTKAPVKKAAGATVKPAAAKPAMPKKAVAARKPAERKRGVGPEQRRHYIEVAAYYIAERHGFEPGRELADWSAAEAEIDRLLTEGLLNP